MLSSQPFPHICCVAVVIVLVAADQLECNSSISSTICVNGEDKLLLESKLIFSQISLWAFLVGLVRSNISLSLGIVTVPRRISLNPLCLIFARNLTSQNFQSSCFPLKAMTLRFFSLMMLILESLCLTTINLGILNCRAISRSAKQTLHLKQMNPL